MDYLLPGHPDRDDVTQYSEGAAPLTMTEYAERLIENIERHRKQTAKLAADVTAFAKRAAAPVATAVPDTTAKTFIVNGHPELGQFRIAASPPVETQHVNLGGFGVVNVPVAPHIFQEALWQKPIPADGVIKPYEAYDYFWPAKRAQNMVKKLNPDAKRQTYDKNIRYLAEKAEMTPQQLLKTNPIPIGRKLGLSDQAMKTLLGNYYYKLSTGQSNPCLLYTSDAADE